MSHGLDQLLHQYESGHISRRDLLGALALLVQDAKYKGGTGPLGGKDPQRVIADMMRTFVQFVQEVD